MTTAKTERHRLVLSDRQEITVDVTETDEAVYLFIGGAKADPRDVPRLAALLWPIVSRYEHDSRPIEMDGPHAQDARLLTLAPGLLAIEPLPVRPRANA